MTFFNKLILHKISLNINFHVLCGKTEFENFLKNKMFKSLSLVIRSKFILVLQVSQMRTNDCITFIVVSKIFINFSLLFLFLESHVEGFYYIPALICKIRAQEKFNPMMSGELSVLLEVKAWLKEPDNWQLQLDECTLPLVLHFFHCFTVAMG